MVTINTESALTPRSLRDTRRMNMFVSVAAAVAGLLFGLDIGVIAGALPFITDHFVLTSRVQEWVVSSMMLGAAIGALFNGWLSFRLGRKYSLMAGAIFAHCGFDALDTCRVRWKRDFHPFRLAQQGFALCCHVFNRDKGHLIGIAVFNTAFHHNGFTHSVRVPVANIEGKSFNSRECCIYQLFLNERQAVYH